MEMTEKLCSRCGRTLSVDMFNKNSASSDGLQNYCRECQSEMHRERNRKLKGEKGLSEELAKFRPVDLINELRARGYTGELVYVHKIKL